MRSLQDGVLVEQQIGLPERGAAVARHEPQSPVPPVQESRKTGPRVFDGSGAGRTGAAALGTRPAGDVALDRRAVPRRVADATHRPRLGGGLEALAAALGAVRVRVDEDVDEAA